MPVGTPDTIERTVTRLGRVSSHLVTWGDRQTVVASVPKKIIVGDSVFRRFICKRGCRSCCLFDLTLDYLPGEFLSVVEKNPEIEDLFSTRHVTVNGSKFPVMSIASGKFKSIDDPCPLMLRDTGDGHPGCMVWPNNPLECQAAPLVHIRQRHDGTTYITKQPFSRAWRYPEPTECVFEPFGSDREAYAGVKEVESLLARYQKWGVYFGLSTFLPSLIFQFHRIAMGVDPLRGFVIDLTEGESRRESSADTADA